MKQTGGHISLGAHNPGVERLVEMETSLSGSKENDLGFSINADAVGHGWNVVGSATSQHVALRPVEAKEVNPVARIAH